MVEVPAPERAALAGACRVPRSNWHGGEVGGEREPAAVPGAASRSGSVSDGAVVSFDCSFFGHTDAVYCVVYADSGRSSVPLLNASGLPTAACHMDARSFVGIPCHHNLRNCEFRCTTVQSGTISRSQIPKESSILLSLAILRSCSAFRRFSSAADPVSSSAHGPDEATRQ